MILRRRGRNPRAAAGRVPSGGGNNDDDDDDDDSGERARCLSANGGEASSDGSCSIPPLAKWDASSRSPSGLNSEGSKEKGAPAGDDGGNEAGSPMEESVAAAPITVECNSVSCSN